MSVQRYSRIVDHILAGEVDFVADDIRVGLLDPAYSFDNGHEFWSDVAADEVVGTGYTADGESLTGKSIVPDGTVAYFRADDVTFTAADFTVQHVVLFVWTGSAATSPLIGAHDLEAPLVLESEDWPVRWDDFGVLALG